VRFRKPKLSDIFGGKDIKSKKVLKQRTQHLFDDGSHQSVQQQARDDRNNVPNPLPCHRFRPPPTLFGGFNIQLFGGVVVRHGALSFGNRQKELYYSAKVVLRGG
jgi:hypothetical protein